jgi:glycosyltransferase involved in cell wall biosynthesis
MKKLTIIVPVYNVEKYLGKCLDSLLDQDIPYKDYEIIIVNDGSNDSSLEVAKSYLNIFEDFIYLFTQENKGVGAARNVGIRQANGKYLFFIDSDDYIRPNCLRNLLNCAENEDLDILRYNYVAVRDNGEIFPKTRNSVSSIVYSENIVDGETFLANCLGWACYPWLFLFKTSLIKENHLIFIDNIYFEDVEWLIRVLPVAKRVRSIDMQVYYYLQRLGSITQSIQFEKKNKIISDKLFIIKKLKQYSRKTYNKKVTLWCNGMISLTIMGILAFLANELPERKKEIIKLIYDQEFLPLKSYQFTFKQKRDLFIININPHLYCYLKRKKHVVKY